MTDWLPITIMVSIASVILSCIFIFYQIHRDKPTLLKLARIIITETDDPTTYNWNLILTIILSCIAFGSGVFILSNVVVFIIIGIWYVDARSVGILAVVFAVFMFKELNKFVTKQLK